MYQLFTQQEYLFVCISGCSSFPKVLNTTGGHREEQQEPACLPSGVFSIDTAAVVMMVTYVQVKTSSGVDVLAHESICIRS